MVVSQNDGRRAVVQCAHHDFTGVHTGLVQRTLKQGFHGQQVVLAVQEQHGKVFFGQMRQVQLQIVFDRLGLGEGRFGRQCLGCGAFGQLGHCAELGLFGRA